MSPALISGVALNALLALAIRNPQAPWLDLLLGVLIIPQLIGLSLIALGQRRYGGRIVLVSALMMIPMGFVAAFAARRLLEDLDREAFELETA